jgi:hypothetical protein
VRATCLKSSSQIYHFVQTKVESSLESKTTRGRTKKKKKELVVSDDDEMCAKKSKQNISGKLGHFALKFKPNDLESEFMMEMCQQRNGT